MQFCNCLHTSRRDWLIDYLLTCPWYIDRQIARYCLMCNYAFIVFFAQLARRKCHRQQCFYIVNTRYVAVVSSRQVQNYTKCSKNVNILEFHDHIWNRHEKCIQISTNMPSIGLVDLWWSMLWNSRNVCENTFINRRHFGTTMKLTRATCWLFYDGQTN